MAKINRRNTTPISHGATDEAPQALVRLLARQAVRDPLAVLPVVSDPTQQEEVINDQA